MKIVAPETDPDPAPAPLPSPLSTSPHRSASLPATPEPEPRETPPATSLSEADRLQPVSKVPEVPAPVSPPLAPRTKGSPALPAPLSPPTSSATPEAVAPALEHLARLLARKDYQRAYELAKTSGWLEPPGEKAPPGTSFPANAPLPPLLQRLLVAFLWRESGQEDRWEQGLRAILQEETKSWPLTLEQLDLCDAEARTGQLRPRASASPYRPGEFVYLRARLRNFATAAREGGERQLNLNARLSLLTPDRRPTSWELLPPDKCRACVSLALVPDYISVPIWFRLPANLPAGPYLLQVFLRDENKSAGSGVEKTLDLTVAARASP